MRLKSQEIFYGLLVCYLSWLGLNTTSNANAISKIQAEQVEDKRVNGLVYNLQEVVIRIDENVKVIKDSLEDK